jgi:hypothetical protein
MTFTPIVPIAMELWDRTPAERPSFVTVASSIPGRLRLRMPERRGDELFARLVKQALAALAGVTQVRANPVTGSVLVLYDPRQTDAPQLRAELERRQLIGRRLPPPPAAPPVSKAALRIGTVVGKEPAKAVLLEAAGEVWFTPLLALL